MDIDLRKGLERRFSSSRQRVLRLAQDEAPPRVRLAAEADLSEAASNLAAYLLATGEPGWAGPPPAAGANDNGVCLSSPHNILIPFG
jgi:hypothetical protein